MNDNGYVKLRMGNATFEQYEQNKFRVCCDSQMPFETDNPILAKRYFLMKIEDIVTQKLAAEFAKRGIDLNTGNKILPEGHNPTLGESPLEYYLRTGEKP